MLARVRRPTLATWPADLDELVLEAVAFKGSKIVANLRKVISGDELSALRESPRGKLFVFPVDGVKPGSVEVAVRVKGAGGEITANVRAAFDIPRPPEPGESHPWFLADRLGRIGSELTLLPALDGELHQGQPAVFVGYGCHDDAAPLAAAHLVSQNHDGAIPVQVDWLDGKPPVPTAGDSAVACGWLAGEIPEALALGLWRFEPPRPRDTERPSATLSTLEFRVVAEESDVRLADAPTASGG